ncbi:MAG: 4Fe-4S binding protein [Myxococcales bacterium]|nr:4Fe-4S binding protein [Myxococcales bacterium]
MSFRAAAAKWFERVVGGDTKSVAPAAGQRVVSSGAAAALAAEVQTSERVFRVAARGELLTRAERSAGPNAFGAPVFQTVCEDPRAAISNAAGRAMAGSRVAVLIPEESVLACHGALHAAVARRAPFIVHAVVSADTASASTLGAQGHGSYHALADTGVILCMARTPQRAADMALIARRAAELSLVPAVIAQEGPETAWAPASLELPSAATVRELCGLPSEELAAQSSAQSMLLGESRRRVPRWFDLDRPAAHGMQLAGQDLALSLAGQHEFFGRNVIELLSESIERFALLTGRKLELVSKHRLEDAKVAFVAQGAAIDAATAVADYLRKERGEKVGVLGIEWLRPLARDEIRKALAHVETITVLERTGDALGAGGPLSREIESALGAEKSRIVFASHGLGGQPLSNSDLLGAFENMKAGAGAKRSLLLGVAFPEAHPKHTRREVLNQKVRGAYPELARSALAIDAPLDLRPASARTVGLWARTSESPEDVLDALATRCAAVVGQHIRSRKTGAEQGTWMAEVSVCPVPLTDPAGGVWHDVAIVAAPELPNDINPLRKVVTGGSALIASPLPAEALWRDLPESWRNEIRTRGLGIWVLNAPVTELVEHAAWLLAKEAATATASGVPERLQWESFPELAPAPADSPVPLAVRRFTSARSTYDNLPRFWGELAEPRIDAGFAERAPDPYLSLGAVPPSTSGLFHVAVHQNRLPQFDAERCTGCGACWSACPDSAIAPSVIRSERLLDAAADLAAEPGAERKPQAEKLKRAHKQLAARVDGSLAKQKHRRLTTEVLRESFDWLTQQMKVTDDDRPEFERAFETTLRAISALPFAVTEAFFHGPHGAAKGSGELLGLALNPAACQACGGCAAVCAEEAIRVVGRTEPAVHAAQLGFGVWERLPDPTGESLAHAAGLDAVGKLPAALASRHTLLSVTGGGGHEPGSGSRLGARLAVAVTEYRQQRLSVTELGRMDTLLGQLREALRRELAQAIPADDLGALERALEDVPDRGGSMTAVLSRLDNLGEQRGLDGDKARKLVHTTKKLQELREAIASGADGMGRARHGLVVTSPTLAEWAAEFPRNPFAAPVVVDLSGGAFDLALGLAESMARAHVAETRLTRLAELCLAAPADWMLKERELEQLTFAALAPVERARAAPMLVLAGPEALSAEGRAGLMRVLGADLPIKVIVLDGREHLLRSGESLLPFVAERRAFVLSTTVAHREHLFAGVHAALDAEGPALIHLYAPRPGPHGFDTAITLERARAAVDCRVHPLLRWDPAAEGVFGSKLSLAGNPALDQPWVEDASGQLLTPAHFALKEARFAACFTEPSGATRSVAAWALGDPSERGSAAPSVTLDGVERSLNADLARAVVERLDTWRTLQELAGVSTPFTLSVRSAAEGDLRAEHQAALAALTAEYEAKLAAETARHAEDTTARLGTRLLELAGYGAARSKPGEGPT